MDNKIKLMMVLITLSFALSSCSVEEADVIIHNATVHTLDELNSKAEAIAIKNGKIIAIGPEHEIMNKYYAPNTIDAQKGGVFPGFIDGHAHLTGFAKGKLEVSLVGTASFEEVLERCKNFNPVVEHEWLIGRGWDQNDWNIKQFPDNVTLSELFPDKPVMLTRIDGHAALLNKKALEIAGFTVDTKIQGGKLLKKNGELTGVILDNAIEEVKKHIPDYTYEQKKKAFIEAQNELLSYGLTGVHDAGISQEDLAFFKKLEEEDILKINIYAMLSVTTENIDELQNFTPYESKHISVKSVKLYADGALGSRGACLLQPYADDTTNYGFLLYPISFLDSVAQICYEKKIQLCTHCIGDSANRVMLNIYKKYLQKPNDRRWRIEHAQVIHPDDRVIFNEVTVIPSVQPTHATSDKPWVESRLGKNRLNEAYAYRSLWEQNKLIALGTDFPVEHPNPLYTFYSAVFRKNFFVKNDKPFAPEEALTPLQTLKGMTIWNAIASFSEQSKGSLEVGKDADLVILNYDLLQAEESIMEKTEVLYTFVNGESVFKK
tara:strand:+ start:6832 stop:8472 length:1641 start_codon:yes stop_codon:yes gene_type:complete